MMSTAAEKQRIRRSLVICLIVAVAITMSLCSALPSAAEGEVQGPSTFYLDSPTRGATISGRTPGRDKVDFTVWALGVQESGYEIELSASSESDYFDASVSSATVVAAPPLSSGERIPGESKAVVTVAAHPDAPDHHTAWVTVSGLRTDTGEVQEHHFLMTNLSKKVDLKTGYRDGVMERETRLNKGEPFNVTLEATNSGCEDASCILSAEVPDGWKVSYQDEETGEQVKTITCPGIDEGSQVPRPVRLQALVEPPGPFAKAPATAITFRCEYSAICGLRESNATLEVVYQGFLWSANDMDSDGLYPHRHQVPPGAKTTYFIQVTNTGDTKDFVLLRKKEVTPGWKAKLFHSIFLWLKPGETRTAVMTLTPPDGAPEGSVCDVVLEANSWQGKKDSVTLSARVSDNNKIYYFAVDSMRYEYLDFNSKGDGPGSPGDWLMPEMREFMDDAVTYTNANALLPSATDMNHTTALSGCYPGTEGIYMVNWTFEDLDEHGCLVPGFNSLDQCLTLDVDRNPIPVERIYEIAEDYNSECLGGFLSNKSWLAHLHGAPDTQDACERYVASDSYPVYVPDPEKYILGDPIWDDNPWEDPLQAPSFISNYSSTPDVADFWSWLMPRNNPLLNCWWNWRARRGKIIVDNPVESLAYPDNIKTGSTPGNHASDTFMGENLIRMIREEDPDVLYLNLGDLDRAGHYLGSADNPDEWDDAGTPGKTWDDTVSYNRYALRDETLDIAREADRLFGEFIQLLEWRGTYDSSVIVLLADHAMRNLKRAEDRCEILSTRQLLSENGYIMGKDYGYIMSGYSVDLLFSDDKTHIDAIEDVFEGYTVEEQGRTVNPFVVYDRDEMSSGEDEATGRTLGECELYSKYYVEYEGEDKYPMIWPDLFVFVMEGYQSTSDNKAMVGSHGSFDTRSVPIVMKVPGWPSGVTCSQEVNLAQIAPTIYEVLQWNCPPYVDGEPLPLP